MKIEFGTLVSGKDCTGSHICGRVMAINEEKDTLGVRDPNGKIRCIKGFATVTILSEDEYLAVGVLLS